MKERWYGLDLLRCLAVLVMIQGHAFTALLHPSYDKLVWYRWHNFFHGFTAPMFLLASGLAFGFTTLRRWEDHVHYTFATRKRVRRYVMLIIVGYFFQLPSVSWSEIFDNPMSVFEQSIRLGPLHVIGFTLLVCELCVLLLKRRRRFFFTMALFTAITMFAAPAVWASGIAKRIPEVFGAWLDESSGSQFPIFPWASFIFFAVAAISLVTVGNPPRLRKNLGGWIFLFGVVTTAVSYVSWRVFWNTPDNTLFWEVHPDFAIFRIGVVALVLAACCLIDPWMKHRIHKGLPIPHGIKLMTQLGQNTLAAYIIHLILLFGSPLTPGINLFFGRKLHLAETTWICLALVLATAALTLLWAKYRPLEKVKAWTKKS